MPDDPTKSEDGLYDWAMNLVDDGRSRRRGHEAQWYENLATYSGDLWTEYDVVNRKLWEPEKPTHKVRLPVNLAQPLVRTEYAKLLKNRPMIDCLARSNDRADLNAADVGDKLLYHYIEKQLYMPRVRRRMLQWTLICGLGGIFVDYDDMALGDQEVLVGPDNVPIFDLNMIKAVQRYYRDRKKAPKTIRIPMGELRQVALSPWQLIWDASKLEFNEAWWCIVSEVYDVDEVFRRWEAEIESTDRSAKPGVMQRRILERWDLTGTLEWSRGDTQKMVEVHRLFVKPGHRYFPNGAEVVFTDNEMITRSNFPFKHGMLPVGVMGHIPWPISQHSMSILPQVKPLVLELSKTESQLIENRNMMGNPPWIEYRQNRIQGEIQNKPGMRLTVEWMPNVPEPHPIEMPEMPSYIRELIPILKEHILEVGGQGEVSQGKVPAGARAGVTIAYLQEEDDTKLGTTVQEYEECSERVAWLQLQTIAEKYDAPRTIRIYRRHSEPEVFDFIGTMLEGVAGVVVQAGSALPRSKAAKQQFILDLWDRKLEQDPRKVREMLELTHGDPDEWEVDVQQAERENRKLMGGNDVEVLDWHNHLAHQYSHQRYMKSADFENGSPEVQGAFLRHNEAHTQALQRQQQQQMMQQMVAGSGAGGPGGPPPQNGGANGVTATPQPPFTASGPTPGDLMNVQDMQPQ